MSSSAAAIAVNSAINTLDSNLNSCARKRRSLINAKESIVEEVFGGKDKSGEIPRPRDDFIETPKKSPKRKKFNSNHEKPMWKTVLSIMIKNGLLLVFLITLGHTIWKYSVVTKGFSHFLIAPALVDQINDIKETAKTLQYQLQVVESKIEGEINFLKEGLTEEINERSNSLETLFRELEVRSDDLEISLNKLKNADFFSREDLQKIIGEIKKTHGSGASAPQLTLDEMRNYAREIIVRELEKHSADGIGRVDFALASGSGRVISHSEAFNYGKSSWFFPSRGGSVHPNAQKMLQPSFGEPGQCFALRGCSGFVEIKLRTGIIPDSVTLEHVSKSVGYDRSSAPKDCRISAWYENPADDLSSRTGKMLTLVEFTYDLEKVNVQTFSIESSLGIVNRVRLEFFSNHGNPSYTCLYRLRVHGLVPDPMNTAMGS